MQTEQKNNTLQNDFAKALYHLFYTQQLGDEKKLPKNKLFNKRQRFKLSRALYFERENNHIDEAKAYSNMQAALVGLETAVIQSEYDLVSTVPTYYQSKLKQFQSNDLQQAVNLNYRRALKYYYKLLFFKRQHALPDSLKASIRGMENQSKTLKDLPVKLHFQALLYKQGVLAASTLAHVTDDEERGNMELQLLQQFTLIQELTINIGHPQVDMAKLIMQLLTNSAFDDYERSVVLKHLKKIIPLYLARTHVMSQSEIDVLTQTLSASFKHLSQELPMTIDPESSIQGILNTGHDVFAWCVKVCDRTFWLGIPWLFNWILFKPLMHAFAMFKRKRFMKQPEELLDQLIRLMFDNSDQTIKALKAEVSKEKTWRDFGYVSAVASAFSYTATGAIALAGLGGVSHIALVIGCVLFSGFVCKYFLHKAYVPNTCVRLSKGMFKGLDHTQKILTAGGVVFAILASIVLVPVTYVYTNQALLQIAMHLGWIKVAAGTSITFLVAATPWVILPVSGMLLFGLAISVFFSFQIFVTNVPIYVKDYTDFVRERRWNKLKIFFKHFAGDSRHTTAQRIKQAVYHFILISLISFAVVAIIYFAMYPTFAAFGIASVDMVERFGSPLLCSFIYNFVVWSSLVANLPFIVQNLVLFSERLLRATTTIIAGIFHYAKVLCYKTQREGLLKSLTWENLKQFVREAASIEDNASMVQLALGTVIAACVVVVMFVMLLFSSYGDGKLGEEGGEHVTDKVPLYLSDNTAEKLVVTHGAAFSFVYSAQAIFSENKASDPSMLNSPDLAKRAQYAKLLYYCEPDGLTTQPPCEIIKDKVFCQGVEATVPPIA